MTKRIFVAIAVCIFFASFTQPAFYIDTSQKDAWSSQAGLFSFGWLGLAYGSFSCIAWLANPLFIISIVLFLRDKKSAARICLLAIVFAASFLFVRTI